jgi:hypothetical protein
MRLHFIKLLFLVSNYCYSQACDKYQCSNCGISYMGTINDRPVMGCAVAPSIGHKWNNSGVDYNCVSHVQKIQEETNKHIAEFEKKKVKLINGQEVISWYQTGKAYISKSGENYTQYSSQGSIDRTLNNGTLMIYQNGKMVEKGTGVFYEDLFYDSKLAKDGIWIENNQKIYYQNGTNVNAYADRDWNNADSYDEYLKFKKDYPLDSRVEIANTKIKEIDKVEDAMYPSDQVHLANS